MVFIDCSFKGNMHSKSTKVPFIIPVGISCIKSGTLGSKKPIVLYKMHQDTIVVLMIVMVHDVSDSVQFPAYQETNPIES